MTIISLHTYMWLKMGQISYALEYKITSTLTTWQMLGMINRKSVHLDDADSL